MTALDKAFIDEPKLREGEESRGITRPFAGAQGDNLQNNSLIF